MLGYDVFNPLEVVPEYVADVGTKRGEKVDYAILRDGDPIIIVECKAVGTSLDSAKVTQLYRYFTTTAARFGILTDGLIYRFFSDLEEPNRMDAKPFLEFDLSEITPADATNLKRFTRDSFNLADSIQAAENLKYTSAIKWVLADLMKRPHDAFVRFVLDQVHGGPKTKARAEQFRGLTWQAFREFINERIDQRLQSALASERDEADPEPEPEPEPEPTPATVLFWRHSKRHLIVLLLLVTSACRESDDTDVMAVHIGSAAMTWESPPGSFWEIRDVLRKDGTVWVLTSGEPFVHGLRNGTEIITFGSRGEGPHELRSAWAFPGDYSGAGTITVWDAQARLYRTFSNDGLQVSARAARSIGTVRMDIDVVTFGDPMRMSARKEHVVRTEYDNMVASGNDLWTGGLIRADGDGRVETVIDFGELRGASQRDKAREMLVPVPLWDECYDGRIALLDPVARFVYMVGASWEARDSLWIPWEGKSLSRAERLGYLLHHAEAEFRGQSEAIPSEIEAMVANAEQALRDDFPSEAPVGVDIRCAPGRVWIQEFDGGAHPLGFGRSWWTVSTTGIPPIYSRVVLPVRFRPHSISGPQMLGIVTDSLGLQRVASIRLPFQS